jgi:AraC family transcriptional regulator
MCMEPKIVETGRMILVGLGFYGDPFRLSGGWTEENEIGRLWNRFMTYLGQHHGAIKNVKGERVAYELQIYHEDTPRTGEFEVFVGVEVEELQDPPLEMSVKILPPATHAVFALEGEQIASDWHLMIVAEWLPQAGHESDPRYSVQRYDERFKGVENLAESVVEVYMPIRSGPLTSQTGSWPKPSGV